MNIGTDILLAFARGYYDGRSIGVENNTYADDAKRPMRWAYGQGYQAGVTDYCCDEQQATTNTQE